MDAPTTCRRTSALLWLLFVLLCGCPFILPAQQRADDIEIKVIKFRKLRKEIRAKKSSDLLLVTFWATWCGPCVREMPQMREVYQAYKDKGLQMVMVSVDPVEKVEKLRSFLRGNDLRMEHYLLNEVNFRRAIVRMDPTWSGEIPATFFIQEGKEQDIHVGYFPRDELFSAVTGRLK